jgi:hypothetical protein
MTDAETQQVSAIMGATIGLGLSQPLITIPGDGAIPVDRDGMYQLTKGSAAAITVAAPGASGVGRRITITGTTDFAHVVTFTGTTLMDGTAGLNTTWTTTAVAGCSLTFVGVSSTRWAVVAQNLGTIAP